MSEHWENCQGVICSGDKTPDWEKNVVWYPGELICNASPMQKFQKIQRRINKRMAKGTFKWPFRYFTAETLAKIKAVTNATYGLDPDNGLRGG